MGADRVSEIFCERSTSDPNTGYCILSCMFMFISWFVWWYVRRTLNTQIPLSIVCINWKIKTWNVCIVCTAYHSFASLVKYILFEVLPFSNQKSQLKTMLCFVAICNNHVCCFFFQMMAMNTKRIYTACNEMAELCALFKKSKHFPNRFHH